MPPEYINMRTIGRVVEMTLESGEKHTGRVRAVFGHKGNGAIKVAVLTEGSEDFMVLHPNAHFNFADEKV